jgi:TolA-binding protein
MKTTFDDRQQSDALAAFTELTRDGVEQPSPAGLDHGLDTLLARIALGKSRRWGRVLWPISGLATAVLALTVGYAISVYRQASTADPPALTYRIEGGSVLEGGYLRESGHAGVKLLFNEGSTFTLTPGTRGRLRSVEPRGARVAIEQGTAAFQVTQRKDRHWLVEVGPFVVAVKGTVFSVSWDLASARFELRLRQGRVVVSGPISGGDIALRAGQRLVVDLPKAETLILEESSDLAAREPESAAAFGAADGEARPPPSPRPVVDHDRPARAAAPARAPARDGKSEVVRRWSEDLANGQWDRILQDVEQDGMESTLARASSEDLIALANAARYRRRADLARAALLAERRRFPGSARALDATFLLGRVEELREQGKAQAIAWYDAYLARAPAGAYAAEALGRKLILTNELDGPAKARPIADEYLRRFPDGSYAGSARALPRVLE